MIMLKDNNIKLTNKHVDEIMNKCVFQAITVFDKCTILACKMPNGFVIVESSGCIDPENYDESIGVGICMERIKDKIFELEGYVLQDFVSEIEAKKESHDDYSMCSNPELDCSSCPYLDNCLSEEGYEDYNVDDFYVEWTVR